MSIDKIKTGDDLTQSLDIVSDNISKLKELFPEVLTEGKIDFKVLQDILGNEIEEDEEFYRFTWAGKSQSRREAHKPSTGTLRPCKEESVDWDTTQNIYIEGDNLEVLKLLQKSYANKVKMIYIDPPYNTGKDFVYKDNYKDNLKNYKQVTGQVDDEGNKLSTNSESDGRYHSNWLNMMYPRIRLARNLLKEDGVIFMSIDENEANNLLKLCYEVFGEENYVSNFVVRSNPRGSQASKFIANEHENVICFCKNLKFLSIKGYEKNEEETVDYSLEDSNGKYRLLGLRQRGGAWRREDRPKMYYPIFVNPLDGSVSLSKTDIHYIESLPKRPSGEDGRWTWGVEKFEKESNLLIGKEVNREGEDCFYDIFRKDYLIKNGESASKKPRSIWDEKEVNYQNGRNEIKELFNNSEIFDFPKPTFLITKCIEMLQFEESDTVLDFFSGSASSAHATLKSSLNSSIRLEFIQIQLPEPTNENSEAFKAGYKTIAEIGKERIRRAGKKITEENPDKAKDLDLGFKVFKLDSSNIKGWDGLPDNLEKSLFESQDNIKSDRKEEDVLFEILLKYGLDLTLPIEEKVIEGKKVFNVGFGALFICLGNDLTSKVAEGIGQWKETLKPETCRVIFKDGGFTDVEKTNSVQTLKRFGIQEIKSI
jgi:adenine-specific DNA-methyltransferase